MASATHRSRHVALHARGTKVVVVHGGGAEISRWHPGGSGIPVRQRTARDRRRGTQVVTAVLAGLVNKQLVSQLLEAGGKAVGLSGVDGGLAHAQITNPALGRVGDIDRVEPVLINALTDAGFLPVISPVCWGTFNGRSGLLNVNADDVAAEVAVAINADTLIYLTDVPGVLDAGGTVISRVTANQVELLIRDGTIRGGMIPKARACMKASHTVPRTRIIDGTMEHALLHEDEGESGGTTIVTEELA